MPTTETRRIPSDGPTVADVIGERPKARAVFIPPSKPIDPNKPPEHEHPRGMRDRLSGFDDQGRRIIVSEPARVATYKFDCPRCLWDDAKRMENAPTMDEDELGCTLFLIPESQYDHAVARAYVAKRYPGKRNVAASFHAEKLAYVRGAQIVVISRRGQPGLPKGPSTKRAKDEEGVWCDMPVAPETYINECVESAPIVIADCMDVVEATMMTEQTINLDELVARLSEVVAPYRIALPVHKDDKLFVMRDNT